MDSVSARSVRVLGRWVDQRLDFCFHTQEVQEAVMAVIVCRSLELVVAASSPFETLNCFPKRYMSRHQRTAFDKYNMGDGLLKKNGYEGKRGMYMSEHVQRSLLYRRTWRRDGGPAAYEGPAPAARLWLVGAIPRYTFLTLYAAGVNFVKETMKRYLTCSVNICLLPPLISQSFLFSEYFYIYIRDASQ
eukprot:gene1115-651_t